MKLSLILLLVLVAGLLAYVRLAPSDPARWHIDPVTAADPGASGALIAPGHATYPVPAADLMQAINAIALAEPRTVLLAGSVGELHATYVTRSKWIGFPDYITVKALPSGEGSTLAILSRARLGTSDQGVNSARLDRWLAGLEAVQ